MITPETNMRKSILWMLSSALFVVSLATSASAEDKTAKAGGVITVEPVRVVGRAPRPQVATEVTRLTPAQHLSELRQPLLDRVEKAIEKSPF